MRNVVLKLIVAAALLIPSSSGASDDAYRLHLAVTDGRTALLMAPDNVPRPSEEALARASSTKAYAFTNASGAHFKWMTVGFPPEKPPEVAINSRGGCGPRNPACDVGFQLRSDGSLRVRCYREKCTIAVAPAPPVTLSGGQWLDAPDPSDFDLAFKGKSMSAAKP